MDQRVLDIIKGNTDLINTLIDRVIELEKKIKAIEKIHHTNSEFINKSDLEIALENGASLDDLPVK